MTAGTRSMTRGTAISVAMMVLLVSLGANALAQDNVVNSLADDPLHPNPGYEPVGGFVDYTDFPSFEAGSPTPLSCITFAELPVGTVVTTEYLPDVEFTDGDDVINNNPSFVQDGVGLDAAGRTHLRFSAPIESIGVFFPGALTIELYDVEGGTLLYTSQDFAGSGTGFFGGVVSNTPFTYVELRDWVDDLAFMDDICYGSIEKVPTLSRSYRATLFGLLLILTGVAASLVRRGGRDDSITH